MQNNFAAALAYVRKDEGGNDDDPRDHGGRTSRGITQREYDAWNRLHQRQTRDVWTATEDEVNAIYREQYWNPYCDQLPSGLDYCFFDISVNAGRSRAVKTFQKVLGVNVDGMVGQVTLEAIKNYPDHIELIKKVSNERRRWYQSLAQFPIYGRGWLNRVDHCERGAITLVAGSTYEKPVTQSKKAKDAKPAGPAASPETSTAATGGLGTITAILEQLRQSLEPYQYIIKPVMYLTLALTMAAAGYTVWSFIKARRVQKEI